MKNLKDIMFILTWMFAAFFGIFFWIAVGTCIALVFAMPLIMAVEAMFKILVVSFCLFLGSAILTYVLNK